MMTPGPKDDRLPEPLLTIEQTADALNMSPETVRRRIKSGQLPVIRDGRIVRVRPADLRAYIALRRCE